MKSKIEVLKYVEFMNEHECVKEWLNNRPANTQECYAQNLKRFCDFANVSPAEFQAMDKKTARDVAWKYLSTLNTKETASVAITAMAALKSFYRNHDGEVLPFDSSKHGKHYVKPYAVKASREHVPNKEETYTIIDKTMSVRDHAAMLVLYQSGIRENAVLNLTYGMVREQLQKDTCPLHLKITDDVDTKLCGYSLAFYDTFIGREAIDALRAYVATRKNPSDDEPLFVARVNKNKAGVFKMSSTGVWTSFKNAVGRAGFDKQTMWVHSLRKSFKSQVRKSSMNEELGEILMGHHLHGSGESYMNRNDVVEELRAAYAMIDFTRQGKTEKQDAEIEKLRKELEEERRSNEQMEKRFSKMIASANEQTLKDIERRLSGLQIEVADRELDQLPRNANTCGKCGSGPEGQPFKTWMLGNTKVSRLKCTNGHEFNVYEKIVIV